MRALDPADADPTALYLEAERPPHVDRPWVLANMVSALDGAATIGGRVGDLSSPADREWFKLVRTIPDTLLVGANTVRNEKYRPTPMTMAVVSRSLELDWSAPLFREATVRPVVLTCDAADETRRGEAAEVADVLIHGHETVDLRAALQALRERGSRVLLTEGGPHLLGELIAAELVDEFCLSITPVVGGDPFPVVQSPAGAPVHRFRLASVVEGDGDLFLRYLRNP
jgi:riboflavin biosynthesis pyrimidine reductase